MLNSIFASRPSHRTAFEYLSAGLSFYDASNPCLVNDSQKALSQSFCLLYQAIYLKVRECEEFLHLTIPANATIKEKVETFLSYDPYEWISLNVDVDAIYNGVMIIERSERSKNYLATFNDCEELVFAFEELHWALCLFSEAKTLKQ